MAFPVSIVVEKRTEDVPRWLPAATSVGSVVVAFVVSGIVLWLIGSDPIRVYDFFVRATFGSWAAFDTMVKATPLILVGLACTVAFKMKLWNIGAEGQFYMGAFFASLVVLVPLAAQQPVAPGHYPDGYHGHGGWSNLGFLPWLSQSSVSGQRNHHNVDAQLCRDPLEQLLDFRPLE